MALSNEEMSSLMEETAVTSLKILKNAQRNAFASAALTGLLTYYTSAPAQAAKFAFEYADAMLAESEKQ